MQLKKFFHQSAVKYLIIGCALGSLNSCSAGNDNKVSRLDDSVVDANTAPGVVELGFGYSEKTGRFIKTQCVQGTTSTQNLPETGGDVSFLVDASYQKVLESLSGSLDVSLSLPAIKASAGASIAKSVASTDLTTNIIAYKNLLGKAQYLMAGTIAYAPGILDLGAKTETYCGTDYVSEIDYGASMVVSLEITAKTKKQKEKITGHIEANLANIIDGRGSLEIIDDNERQDYRVRLFIKQVGGVPQNVALAIPEDGLYCFVDDMQTCLSKMNAAITYMRGQWRSDLFDLKNWNPIKYQTASYASSVRVNRLAPKAMTASQKEILQKAYDFVKTNYDEHISDLRDAESMMTSDLTRTEKSLLKPIQQQIFGNVMKLDRTLDNCLNNFDYCLDIASDIGKIGLVTYDSNFRTIGYARRARVFCSDALRNGQASGELTNTEVADLMLEGSSPVFNNPKDNSSRVIGFEPCMDVFESSLSD